MKRLKEFELKTLDQITGGITIKLEFTNVFDGNPKNDDVRLTAQGNEQASGNG
jgi:hypothetical protein